MVFIWIGLAIALLPLLLRLVAQGYQRVRTSFDLPLLLILTGGLIGLIVSPHAEISLGAFLSLLAITLVYYAFANYPYPATLLKWGLPVAILGVLTATVFSFSQGSTPATNLTWFNAWAFESAQHLPKLPQGSTLSLAPCHGLALALIIVTAISIGIAAFGKRIWLRIIAASTGLCSLGAMLLFTTESIVRLFTWESIRGRIPLWEDTVDMLRASPFTGIGLGCWAPTHNPSLASYPTHPHNAYLELYANTGMLGALAFTIFLVIGARLLWDILRASRRNPWYGFGVGVLLASLATILIGVVESAPMGIPVVGAEAYFYIVSPVPWLLAALLIVAHRLLCQHSLEKEGLRTKPFLSVSGQCLKKLCG
jgi:O-antigen ligase